MIIQKDDKKLSFLEPKYIYIPIDNTYQISNNYIYKLEEITTNNHKLYSSISGNIENIVYKLNYKNQKIKCIAIKNDYKEKTTYKKKYPFISINIKNKLLLVDAYDIEPYLKYKSLIIKNYTEEILETIDYLLTKYHLKQAIIMAKDKDIKLINNYIGSYPNITTSNYTYRKSISVVKIYHMYKYLKYQKPMTTKNINIITPKKNINIEVKIGTVLSEILDKFNLYKDIDKNYLLIINSFINGSNVSSDDLIITTDIDAIIFIKNNFSNTQKCINCSKCASICPVKLIPSYIMKYSNNIKKLKLLQPQKCIECGLCSFICPSKIEIKEHIIIAKGKVE